MSVFIPLTSSSSFDHHEPKTNHIPFIDKTAQGVHLNQQALGRLQRELRWMLGEKRMHGIMARWGLTCGLTNALEGMVRPNMIEGLGTMNNLSAPDSVDEFIFEVPDSHEANEYKLFHEKPASTSQCWLLAGFLSGFISTQMDKPIYFIETQCRAKNHGICRFEGKTKQLWPDEMDELVSNYEEDNMALELAGTRELLQLTKDRYQNIFEQSSMPILIIDPDTGIILDANAATEELTGFIRSDLLQMNIFDLLHSKDHPKTATNMKGIIADSGTDDEEVSLIRKDGAERIVANASKIIMFGGRKVIQRILRDVTDLKVIERKEKDLQFQLQRSERLSSIGRLAAGVAHEIKNPLGAIRNAIYYIRGSLQNLPIMETDQDLKKIINLAEEEVDGAVRIIEELLDFSRVVSLIPRKTNINELLDSLPQIISVPQQIQIEWDLDMTLPSATVDPDRLRQVFCNITNNAIQAMPHGGKLTIRSRYEVSVNSSSLEESSVNHEAVSISFQDTGTGIEPLHLTKIFEPLFTTKVRGTGLGLAISSNIIEKHGGSIHVQSKVGKGTAFTLKIPLHVPKPKEEQIDERK